jgi:hypothetical protein
MDIELIRMLFHHRDHEPAPPKGPEAATNPEHPANPPEEQ